MKKELPKIKFGNMSVDEVAELLSWTVHESDGPFPLSGYSYEMYPELKEVFSCDPDKINCTNIIKLAILKRYDEYLDKNSRLPDEYQEVWDKYNDKFMVALSERLDIKWPKDCSYIEAGVGRIPIYPRDIKKRTFDIGKMDHKWVIETSMHECCHFLFFEKWKELYPDWKWEDFDSPHIIWYLSEMLVDQILNCPAIQDIFINNFRAYDSFYNVKINGKFMMSHISDIFKDDSIEGAIKKSYDYILRNEETVRKQCDG